MLSVIPEWKFSMSSDSINYSPKVKCSRNTCNDEATVFLEIVRQPVTGYYCEHCAIDIKLHGIAEEVIPVIINPEPEETTQ